MITCFMLHIHNGIIQHAFYQTLTFLYLVFYLTIITLVKTQHNHRLQIEINNLVVHINLEAYPESEIKIMVLKIPRSRLFHPLD